MGGAGTMALLWMLSSPGRAEEGGITPGTYLLPVLMVWAALAFFTMPRRANRLRPGEVDQESGALIPESLGETIEADCVRQIEGRRRWLRFGIWGGLSTVGGLGYYYQTRPPVTPLYFNGLYAFAHVSHPPIIHQLVAAANELVDKPYQWGGGHQYLNDKGFDCSGAVSHVLYRARLLEGPLNSSAFAQYALPGQGVYVTLYVKPGQHVFMEVCGLRFDTSGSRPGEGPRWRITSRSRQGFQARHPAYL